jgi:protein-tyrosine phosphatase
MPKPIEHCYWVVEDKLLAGEYPRTKDPDTSQKKIEALIRAGVTLFIDLTEETEGLLAYGAFLRTHTGVSHRRFPIRDLSTPRSEEATKEILDAIDGEIEKGGVVYVHCWGGVGRTGTIVGCWLARNGHGGKAAVFRLREIWQQCPKSAYRNAPETPEQERYIIEWKETL